MEVVDSLRAEPGTDGARGRRWIRVFLARRDSPSDDRLDALAVDKLVGVGTD